MNIQTLTEENPHLQGKGSFEIVPGNGRDRHSSLLCNFQTTKPGLQFSSQSSHKLTFSLMKGVVTRSETILIHRIEANL